MRVLAGRLAANDKMSLEMAANVLVITKQGMLEQLGDVFEADRKTALSMIEALGIAINCMRKL